MGTLAPHLQALLELDVTLNGVGRCITWMVQESEVRGLQLQQIVVLLHVFTDGACQTKVQRRLARLAALVYSATLVRKFLSFSGVFQHQIKHAEIYQFLLYICTVCRLTLV